MTIKIDQFVNDIPPETLKAGGSRQSPYLPEGRHVVKVVEVADKGPNKYDTNWHDIDIECEADSGKTGRATLCIPTKTLQYQTTKGPSTYRARDLLAFCTAAWGDKDFPADVATYIRKKFAMAEKTLMRLKFEVEVGHPYGRVYPKKVGGIVKLFKNGEPADSSEFATFDAAEAFATQQGLKYSKFPKIVKFFPLTKAEVEDDLPL